MIRVTFGFVVLLQFFGKCSVNPWRGFTGRILTFNVCMDTGKAEPQVSVG